MLRRLIYFKIFTLIIFAASASAAPFLVCDPQTGIANYEITGDIVATQPAEADGSIKYDLSAMILGGYNIEVKACNLWGDCSDPTPFFFERAAPAQPSSVRLDIK
jgi:hypothetical protein